MTRLRYDISMIRDFLAHLSLEVRVAHSESTPHATHLSLETVQQRKGYADKYGTNLLPKNRLQAPGVSRDKYDEVSEKIRASFEARYAEWIRNLEALRDLFDDALTCAGGEGVTERVIDISEVEGNLGAFEYR